MGAPTEARNGLAVLGSSPQCHAFSHIQSVQTPHRWMVCCRHTAENLSCLGQQTPQAKWQWVSAPTQATAWTNLSSNNHGREPVQEEAPHQALEQVLEELAAPGARAATCGGLQKALVPRSAST